MRNPWLAALVACLLGQLVRLSTFALDESTPNQRVWEFAFTDGWGQLALLFALLALPLSLLRRWKKTPLATGLGILGALLVFACLHPGFALNGPLLTTIALTTFAILHFPGWTRFQQLVSSRSEWLELRRSRALWSRLSKARRVTLATLGCLAILAWQASFFYVAPRAEPQYILTASVGSMPMLEKFVDSLYRLNLFPLAQITLVGPNQVPQWVTELGIATRYGDHAKAYLYLPDAYWKGNADAPSLSPSSFLAFSLALLGLFVQGCRYGYPTLAAALVLLLGSNPFQLQEIYNRSNIFSWTITVAIVSLAFQLGCLLEPEAKTARLPLSSVILGILLGSMRQVRSETCLIAASIAVSFLLLRRLSKAQRVLRIAVMVGALMLTQMGWKAYFHGKVAQAEAACRAWGGRPYSGPRDDNHALWHPLWCGLGDYGSDRGYVWDDRAPWRYAQPLLREQYHIEVEFDASGYYLTSVWDDQPAYPKVMTDIPQYEGLIRAKVVGDITQNPLWMGSILLRRINRIIRETTPVRATVGGYSLPLPFTGLLCLPLLLVLVASRNRLALPILFVIPTSLVSLLIYSGRGTCFYSIYHLVAAAVVLTYVLELCLPERKADV